MPYYRTCPYCGAHLDPSEVCECKTPPSVLPTPKAGTILQGGTHVIPKKHKHYITIPSLVQERTAMDET